MDNLGGASFKVTADPSSFMAAMSDAEKKAVSSSRAISTSVKEASGAIELASDAEVRASGAFVSAMDREAAAAVKATQAQQAISRALHETAATAQQAAVSARTVAGSLEATGHGGSAAHRGLLQAAYALDDLQYGFRSIVNNIPQMLMFLGPAIAGAAGVAAVAISQLINHWDDLTALFSGDKAIPKLKTDLEGLADQLKEITAEVKNFQAAVESRSKGDNWLGPLSDAVFGGNARDEPRLDKLKDLSKEAQEKLDTDKAFDALAGNDAEKETASRVKAAIGKMGEGSGTLLNVLKDQGVDPGEAQKLIVDASKGKEYALDTIKEKIKGQEGAGFRELENASPATAKAIEEQDEADKKFTIAHDKAIKAQEDADKLARDQAKFDRVQALEGQRALMVEQHHQEDLRLQQAKDQLGHGSQTLDGPKAVSDFYQKAAADSPLVELAKATKAIQEQQRTELQEINKKLDKERAVRPG